jgi:predicted Fe-Mo cluster-binding NifX family protein
MKIIITTTSPTIESEVDQRFGRGAYFLTADTDTLQWEAQPNPGVSAPGGAGIQAAQFAAEKKVDAVISGDFGPNAYDALQAADVAMYLFGSRCTVREAIERFKAGKLERVGAPTGQGRHHRG